MGLPLTSIVPWLALGTKAQTGGLACTHRGAWICRQGTQVLTAGKEQSDGPRGVAQTRVLATSWQSQGPEARRPGCGIKSINRWSLGLAWTQSECAPAAGTALRPRALAATRKGNSEVLFRGSCSHTPPSRHVPAALWVNTDPSQP